MIMSGIYLTGCRSAKEIQKEKFDSGKEISIQSIENKKNYNKCLKINSIDNVLEESGKEYEFNAVIGIKRDEFILISLVPMAGVEIMRIYCTEDSIIIINRRGKSFNIESWKEFSEKQKIEIELKDIQAICANEFFRYGTKETGLFEKKSEETRNNIKIIEYQGEKKSEERFTQVFYYNMIEGTIEKILLIDAECKTSMNIVYQDFERIGEHMFPKRISAKIRRENDVIKMRINIRKVDFEKDLNISIDIPAHYKKIAI